MAGLSIKYGRKANLPAYSSALEGALLITTEERAVYANVGGAQFRIGDFQVVEDLASLPAANSVGTSLFFVKSVSALAISDGTKWLQLNVDTGATSVAFSGGSGSEGAPAAGEVISGVSYNSQTRTLNFVVTEVDAEHVTYGNSNVKSALDNKTDRTLTGSNGKAYIFNESDGGGAKFEHDDGTMSFVGVNDGGEDGITGQIYTLQKNSETNKYEGTRINMTMDGFYYTKGRDSSSYTSSDEIATKGDIVNSKITWSQF